VAKLSGRQGDLRPPGVPVRQLLRPERRRGPAEADSSNGPGCATGVSEPVYPAAISRVALIGSFKTLHSALKFASLGRTRSVSQK